ncbi:MAG: cytochrome P450 [bacterium]|nr:cytochrome P450 [bacterium]
MTQAAGSYPSTGFGDLLRLAGGCGAALVRAPGSFDLNLALQDWIEGLVRRSGSKTVVLDLYRTKLLIVTGGELSEHILAQPPDVRSYVEGPTKARAMSFLAPNALTITHGEQWRRLRRFNEETLSAGDAEERLQFILDGVRRAFAGPVSDIDDVRSCMAEVMRTVVFGSDRAPAHLADDVQTLIQHVQNPGRRMLFGWRERGRRKRFYDTLRRLWGESPVSGSHSLMATARRMVRDGGHPEEEILQQIPHWMFTFTGSGTDLLARTLGIVASRSDVYGRVQAEAAGRNTEHLASAVNNMEYLESCLLEACRLFPPVKRTFHVAPQGDSFDGFHIPAGMEILHCFTAGQRDLSVDPTADDFRPERWMEPGSVAAAVYPGLFLGGARECPGKNLILFVCKAAIATLMNVGRMRSVCPALSEDPMPPSFPAGGLRYGMDTG